MAHRGNKWAASREIRLEAHCIGPVIAEAVTRPNTIIPTSENDTAATSAK